MQSDALTTVQRVKDFCEINNNSLDTKIERIIDSVTVFVQNYCRRTFIQTTYSNEEYDGTGTNKLALNHGNVTSITSLQARAGVENVNSWSTINAQNYFIRTKNGIIETTGWIFAYGPRRYRATYVAGWAFDNAGGGATLESVGLGDLEYAVWKLCNAAILNSKDNPKVQSETIGNYSTVYRKEVNMDAELKSILDAYDRPYLA